MANDRRPDFTKRILGAWEGFRNLRDGAAQNPGGVLLGAPPTGPMTFAEPTADERGRGAYEPYVSPPFRLAAAWSWRLIVVVVALGGLFWLMSTVSLVLLPALIALLLAALLTPVHSLLVRLGWPRALSAGSVFVGFLILVTGTITLVGQQIVVGFGELSGQVVAGFTTISDWLNSNPFGLDSSIISGYIDEGLEQGIAYLEENASNLVGGAAGAVSSVGTFATGLLLTLFTAFFFLYDGRRMFTWAVRLMPRPARAKTEGAALRGWQTLVQYVRVQIIVAGVDAVGIGIGALVLGIPLAIPLTVLVFLASFIPIVGAVATGIIAVVVALVSQGLVSALIMLGVVLVVQQIEGNVLQPFIMGKAVSVHPLAVVLAVAAGAFLFGIAGALFAVPVIAVANTVVRFLAGDDVFAEADEKDRPDDDEPPRHDPDPSASRPRVAAPVAAGAPGSAGEPTVPPASARSTFGDEQSRDRSARSGAVGGSGEEPGAAGERGPVGGRRPTGGPAASDEPRSVDHDSADHGGAPADGADGRSDDGPERR
ncbi:AI-2E family transporter [Brevibacterium jeotgali]|uniref:Predicted PurR-regulated permease PerM n=1 Tax=Brevibacterium jeotgali TaxID=1262550 RepID=A0A2H1L617_9MICO|nr:AI-2E family transporter [Brevibacterium jeotgali]TWC03536.1 putative PurR-regulated permease PerM [Brevibacterium jeotgali]SMY12358.1 Predicted PurR-regulated permease PerM [Brevibacterium jeotgali]